MDALEVESRTDFLQSYHSLLNNVPQHSVQGSGDSGVQSILSGFYISVIL